MENNVGPESGAPLFTGRTGEVLRPGSLGYFWRKVRKSFGLTHVRFHDLRHFHATEYSNAGASLREVVARGGWKSTSMVARYQHATPERDAELVRKLPPIVASQRTDTQSPSDHVATKSEKDEESETESGPELGERSGGETRTLNLAVNSRSLCH
jgi:hypothetical protein